MRRKCLSDNRISGSWSTGCKQIDFTNYELTTAKKQTKPEKYASELEAVVPWHAVIDLSKPSPQNQ